MQELWLVIIGLAFGFLVSIPVGPVSLMAINRALHFGFGVGFTTGLGATVADGLLAAIAVFGLKAALAFVDEHMALLQLVGGTVIVIFGAVLINHRPLRDPGDGPAKSYWRGTVAAFAMSITNPGTLVGFLALFSGIQDMVTEDMSAVSAAILIGSVMGGAVLWWLLITSLAAHLRERMTARAVSRLNAVSGTVMMTVGFVMVFRTLLLAGGDLIGA